MHGISETTPPVVRRVCVSVGAWNSRMQAPPLAWESMCHLSWEPSCEGATDSMVQCCSAQWEFACLSQHIRTRHRPSSSSEVPASHQGRVKALATGQRWRESPSQVSIKRLGGSQEIATEAISLIWAICLSGIISYPLTFPPCFQISTNEGENLRRGIQLKWQNRHLGGTIHICNMQASVQDRHYERTWPYPLIPSSFPFRKCL